MAAKTGQTYANHTRWDPAFHFFVLPVAGINLVATIWNLINNPSLKAGWIVILATAAVVAVSKVRLYPLKAQDRIIRLEERERLVSLLADPLRSRVGDLTEAQLVGLRFACDAEIPVLVEASLAKKLSQSDIKKSIKVWRADYFRV
jgi:hypothetical protein